MRRIVSALAGTVAVLVLLFSYHTSTEPKAAAGSGPGVTAAATPPRAVVTPAAAAQPVATGGSGGSGDSGATASAGTAGASRAYDGQVVQTRWGPVQVRITVSGRRITAATALQSPSGDRKSSEISGWAVPALNQQAVTQQSAQLDGVSGATYTSQGYAQSLQSAIDAAGL